MFFVEVAAGPGLFRRDGNRLGAPDPGWAPSLSAATIVSGPKSPDHAIQDAARRWSISPKKLFRMETPIAFAALLDLSMGVPALRRRAHNAKQ